MKRVLIHDSSGFNLGLMMRRLIGVGTPRGLQGRWAALITLLITLRTTIAATLGDPPPLSSAAGDSTAGLKVRWAYAAAC